MWQRIRFPLLVVGAFVVAGIGGTASAAEAAVTPTLTLDQTAGTAAGSFTNVGVDLKFSSSSGDSPKQLTLNLPPGLLANASINGGACLATADLGDDACQVGTGVVTANLFGTIPVPAQVTFDLVPPPGPGDLAGLAVNNNGTQIGTTADIKVRPSGDPAGVGVTIDMVLPNSLSGTPISITEINSTFDSLRYPTTCPSSPQSFSVTMDSYDDATLHTVSAPLSVTGCSALSYAPAFSVTAARDRADAQVALSTTVTEGATEAPSRSVSLALPRPTLTPNIQAVGALCQDLSSGNCTQVGYVTARSPLYPSALTGQAYLTGNIAGLSLTLVFPAPFPLTLIGAVDLGKNATTFTGLPDIPLTDLTVSLGSGARGVFGTSCKSPSGTATATLTNQNGDKTVAVPAKFTIAGCPGHGGGKGGGTGGGNGAGRSTTIRVGRAFLAGLTTGHPSLGFRIAAAKGASRLRRIMVVLPHGLSFVRHRAGRRIVLTGIHVSGGRVASLTLSRGRLMITLHTATGGLTVSIGPRALAETAALKNQAVGGRINRLVLTLVTTNTAGKQSTLRVQFNHPGR